MAHWYQLARAFGGGNSRESGDFQRISLRVLRQGLQDLRRHLDEGRSRGFAPCRGLLRDINHLGAAGGVVMGELLFHRKMTVTNSPAASFSLSGGTTR